MMNKRAFITARKAQYAVSTLCRIFEVSRGWFYGFRASQAARDQRQTDRGIRDAELLAKIKIFFKASKKCYGSKRIHQDLLAEGDIVSERRVARVMKENKVSPLFRKRRKPVTTDSNHKLKPSPNLLEQKFHCQTPNTVWLVDVTYIDTDECWLYLAGIKDTATREIVGWAMEDHMRAELCCEALKMALGRRGPVPGLIHHSDRGKSVRWGEISQTDQQRQPYSINEPKGQMPGQRADGELLCFTEKGVGAPSAVQNPRSGQGYNLRIHRGLL